jgi:ABC-type bacteriocin/lantibiotic exporter with double-glycine peptidase domain
MRLLADIPDLIEKVGRRSLVASVFAVAQSLFLLPVALLVRHIFDYDVKHNDELAVLGEGALIALCYAASAMTSIATRAYAARVTKEAVSVLRRDLIEKLCGLPLSWHDRNDSGTVHSVVIQDCERVDRMVNALMSLTLPALLTSIGLAVVAAALNPVLFGVLIVAVPIMLIASRRFAGTFHRRLDAWHSTARAFSVHAQLLLTGIATIRAAGAEKHEVERFNREIDGFVQAGYDSAVAGSRYGAWQGAVATVAGVAVLVVGGILVARHSISVGSLIAFYAVVALILRQVSTVLSATPSILEGRVAVSRVKALIATEEPHTYHGTDRIELRGTVELRQVTFGYQERLALEDVNLVIEPGEQVAVMGPNGAGKTTLLAVMLGLYRPRHGSILIDGVPLADLDLGGLRRQIGVLLQDAALFPGTIRDNIKMGAQHISDEAMVEAARIAEATEFITALPDGFATRLGDAGIGLSGGQRQRLGIARAVAGRPALLLLDEPTANLPGDLSALVMGNLCRLPWHPAIVTITHDVTVAAHARRILRLEAGRLTEAGFSDYGARTISGATTSAPSASIAASAP